MIDRVLTLPERRAARIIAGIGLLFALAYGASLVVRPKPDGRVVIGDALHHYVQLRSAVFDGDLHFENEYVRLYRLQGGEPGTEWVYEDTPTGHVRNLMPVGPAILWLPLFLLITAGVWLANLVGAGYPLDGYARLFQATAGFSGIAAATAGVWLSWRACAALFTARAAAWACLVLWLASSALYYSVISPTYSHAASLLATSAFWYVWIRTRGSGSPKGLRYTPAPIFDHGGPEGGGDTPAAVVDRGGPEGRRDTPAPVFDRGGPEGRRDTSAPVVDRGGPEGGGDTPAPVFDRGGPEARRDTSAVAVRRYILLGLLAGVAALMRWQDAILLAPIALDLLIAVRASRLSLTRAAGLGVAAIAAAALAFVPQMLVWLTLYGQPLAMPQGGGFMRWTEPALISVLFSDFHGLFTWTPIVAIAVAGLVPLARRDGALAAGAALFLVLSWYVNAAVADWWAGEAFGARRFVSGFPVLALALAALIDRWRPALRTLALVATLIVVHTGLLLVQYQAFMHGLRDIAPYPRGAYNLWVARFVVPFDLLREWLSR